MESGKELIQALELLSLEKGVDKEIIFEAIEISLVSACKKQYGANAMLKCVLNRENGDRTMYLTKAVVEEVLDDTIEISIDSAREINPNLNEGDMLEQIVFPKDFGRISVQSAKQVVVQKVREAERELLYNEYTARQNDIITGVVQRKDRKNIIINLGRIEGIIMQSEQMPKESYNPQDRMRVFVLEVKQHPKGINVSVSRTNPGLLLKLFHSEVPEVSDGIVEIKGISREAGSRSKIAVYSKHPHVDPVGSCVGPNGQRVNIISSELRGEKIDIIQWNSDPAKFIAAALSPGKVTEVAVNPLENAARVVVPDQMLSLAIGKEGQNARLAAKLTGWRIDIKSESQTAGTDFLIFPELERLKNEEKEHSLENAYANYYETTEDEETTETLEVAASDETTEAGDNLASESEEYSEEYYEDEYFEEEYYDTEYTEGEYYEEDYYEEDYYDEDGNYYEEEEFYDEHSEEVPPEEITEDETEEVTEELTEENTDKEVSE